MSRTRKYLASATVALALLAAPVALMAGAGPVAATPVAIAGGGPSEAEPIDFATQAAKTTTPISLASISYVAYVGFLNAGATGRYCFHFGHANQGPVSVSAAALEFNVVLTTVSTDLENRLNYGWTYCATIRNSSGIGSGVNLHARAAL